MKDETKQIIEALQEDLRKCQDRYLDMCDQVAALRKELAAAQHHSPCQCYHYHVHGCCGHGWVQPAITWTNVAAGAAPLTYSYYTTNTSSGYQLPAGGSN